MEITLPISSQPSRWLPLLLAIAIFMQMLDATILNTALPNIAADLDESPLDMHSAVVVYTLTVALLIPLSGYLADRFGTRNVFVGSMAVFIAGSLLCAAAQNLPMLVVARMVQGVGGSMLAPVPRLTIIRVYEKSQLLNAINYAVMPALIGPIFGPPVGGYLVEYASWHWIFLLNVPIGLIGIAAALKIMPNVKGVRVPFDTVGFLMFASAACALIMAVEVISHPQAVPFAAGLAVAGAAALWLYAHHARRTETPLYAGDLFQVRTFRLGLVGNLFSRLGISSVPFLLPLLFQVAFGFGAGLSGGLVAAAAFASLLAKPLVRPIMAHYGYRGVLTANTRLLGILIMLVALLLAMGLCNSIQFSAMNTLTLADLRPYQAGSGNSLMAVNQQLSMSFGIALGALMLQGWTKSSFGAENLHTAFRLTFLGIGAVTFASGFIFARLHRSDGQNLTE